MTGPGGVGYGDLAAVLRRRRLAHPGGFRRGPVQGLPQRGGPAMARPGPGMTSVPRQVTAQPPAALPAGPGGQPPRTLPVVGGEGGPPGAPPMAPRPAQPPRARPVVGPQGNAYGVQKRAMGLQTGRQARLAMLAGLLRRLGGGPPR